MSLLSTIKSLLPASSRSLHAMYRELGQMHQQMGEMWAEVGMTRINVTTIMARLEELDLKLRSLDNKVMLTFWEGYRREDESADEARARFFSTMGSARGGLRVYQLASAQLLAEFDAFCEKYGLTYSVVSGTILGAVRHKGFIPWDDDLDVGMPRRDIERAIGLVELEPRYRITVRYDYNVHCKQVRFCYADETVPCFVDLFYYDMVKSVDAETFEARELAREALRQDLWHDEALKFWNEQNPMVEADSPEGELIAPYFDEAVACLYSEEGPYTNDSDLAAGVILGIDNIDALVDHHTWYMVRREDILPLQRLQFEGHPVSGPHEAWKCAEVHYGDLYELPNDIGTHFDHFSRDLLRDECTKKALEELAQGNHW